MSIIAQRVQALQAAVKSGSSQAIISALKSPVSATVPTVAQRSVTTQAKPAPQPQPQQTGHITLGKPFWQEPHLTIFGHTILGKKPEGTIIDSPVGIGAVGAASTLKIKGLKMLPAILGGGAGFLLGRLFGGSSQEQQQDITQSGHQEATVTPTQVVSPASIWELLQQYRSQQDSRIEGFDIGRDVGGGVQYSPLQYSLKYDAPTYTNIYNTKQYTSTHQTTITSQDIYNLASQEAEQKQDNTSLLLIAAAAIGAIFLFNKG